ncbi:TetR/AcrR family transcriptional regulator [Nonomuraea basaltis]|uniref:TetR/AcrR family transcriptional regulator n=1 Tax=Nonomuraea basaltis TaxID=2495887 RepID=UPI00110C5C91|nr:TetR/AcrR family transcriptional regulator [Nonomuraea basaltis]TMR87965.1 TetR/AcrR family transcriptional regulator [Nonomuraea basaltis]
MKQSYHHGDLRKAVLAAAVEVIEESGPGAVNLRDLARRVGVSHAAPAHHFGDKAGLLTALATEGYDLLTGALQRVEPSDLREAGVAYVTFAVEHRAHFAVMFRLDLLRTDDAALQTAQARSEAALGAAVAGVAEPGDDIVVLSTAAWSLVHGFATLWLQGVLPAELGNDVHTAARAVAGMLSGVR